MKQLEELRDRIRQQIEALQQNLEGIEMSIRTLAGESAEKPVRARAARSNVKNAVLELLQQVKKNGLNASMVVDIWLEKKGEKLERGSVSSLLSRFKSDGAVVYDGKLYRLKEYAPAEPEPIGGTTASVHPLRASGDTPRG
jgi:hypothetical protein